MPQDFQSQIDALKRDLEDLKRQPVNLLDVFLDMKRPIDKARGLYQVVSSAPSAAPQDAFDQIQIYTNGATYRLYWYDWNAQTWHYCTGV